MSKKTDNPVGAALGLLRRRRHLTQMEVMRRGGPNFRTISKWEQGHMMPGLPALRRFLAAIGCDFYDFQEALETVGDAPESPTTRWYRTGRRMQELETRMKAAMEEMEKAAAEGRMPDLDFLMTGIDIDTIST